MRRPCKISVVIPCFNHGEFLPEAVASVTRLGWHDIELIVVDDGSTDERTRQEMDKLKAQGIKVIRQENKGLSAARNAAIVASQGEYIFPLDADDRMRSGWIDRAIEILDSNPKVGVVYGDAAFFGIKTGRWCPAPFDPEQLLERNMLTASGLYRRLVWDQNGGYDERMLLGFEDWDFWVGAAERGWEFAYLPEVFFEYRKAAESMLTRAVIRQAEVEDFIAKKHGPLYRRAWLRHAKERVSIKRTSRRLAVLLLARAKSKCHAFWRSDN
jgi:glycosyltransferase involved in cell wall biosynthesis